MFTTIRGKLLISFLVFGLALIAIPLLISTSLNGMVTRYQVVVDDMINIYEITSLTDKYRDAYLNVIQNAGVEKQEQSYEIAKNDLEEAINNINIVNNPELIVTAQGVVNIVNNILEEGDRGYEAAQNKDLKISYDIYESIFEYSAYVKENVGKLSLLELGQIVTIQSKIEEDRLLIIGLISGTAILILIMSFVFASIYSKTFASPLIELSKSVKSFGDAGYHSGVSAGLLTRKDEVGIMARSYEEMRKKILSVIEEQRKIQLDLKNKNKELVEMNDMMIGRELKMVELKNKLDTLSNQSS